MIRVLNPIKPQDGCFAKVTCLDRALHKKWSFSLRISSVNVTADMVTFTEKILNWKLYFLCSAVLIFQFIVVKQLVWWKNSYFQNIPTKLCEGCRSQIQLRCASKTMVNPLIVNFPLLHPLKSKFFWCFQGV